MVKQIRTLSGTIPVVVALVLLAWYVYRPAMSAPFVYDDYEYIVENPYIRLTAITPENLADILKNRHGRYIRPLACATFAFNYYFGRYEVRGYHQINLLIHVITALLVFSIARQTLRLCGDKNGWEPFLVAALWLVNPIHIQSVTYIVQRINALAALFYLLALVCYIRARTNVKLNPDRSRRKQFLLYALCLTAAVLGLAAKPIVASLPVIIFLYEWYFFQNLDRRWLQKNSVLVMLTVLTVITLGFLYLGASPLDTILSRFEQHHFTLGQRLLTEPQVILYYLTLLFFPHPDRLNLVYNFPLSITPTSPSTTLPAIIGLLAMIAVAVYTAPKHRLLSFGILWFVITLVIESSIIALDLIFEHRTYLPSVFLAIIVIHCLFGRINSRRVAVLTAIVLIAVSSYATYQRNRVWADPLRFWQDNADKSPENAVAMNNLGLVYKNTGFLDQALFYSKKALTLRIRRHGRFHPKTAESLNNTGLVYLRKGDSDRALEYFSESLSVLKALAGINGHQLSEIYNNIGLALEGKGDWGRAADNYQRALSIEKAFGDAGSPNTAAIYNNLGSVWYKNGDIDKAIANYDRALAIRKKMLGDRDPQVAESYNNLGLAYGSQGDYQTAVQYYQQALAIELAVLGVDHPYTATTYFNLGLTFYAQKDYGRTVFFMRKVLTLYTKILGRNHPYIQTAQSILNQALLNSRGIPSTP